MIKKISLLLSLTTLLVSFMAHSKTLNTGPWRFELRATHGTIPFVINLNKQNGKYSGALHNGKENIKLDEVTFLNNQLKIPLQMYEMGLELKLVAKDQLTGFLIRYNKNPQVKIPVYGLYGEDERFPEEKSAPKIELTGRWAVTMTDEQNQKSPGIIVFEQKGNALNGTILTTTGDYRYFEGFVSGNEFEAASFDGVYNYLLRGRILDGTMDARILSNSKTKVEGKKDDKAELPDAYKQTQVSALNFQFPDLSGKMVSLNDPKYQNKPVIIIFFGSWCPNCIDEMNYLIPWYKENKKRGIEIIALSFERSLNEAEAKKQLLKVQKKKNVPYALLLAGSTSVDKPMEKIPGLKNFMSFPTTVFLNKKHEVVKVHAGFNGPSTGEFYEKWKVEFTQTVTELLK